MKKCRICGCTDEDCSQCIAKTGEPCEWVPELENEEGGICTNCLDLFMGGPFQVVRADGLETFGNMEEGVAYDNENPPLQISVLDPVGEEGPPPPIISNASPTPVLAKYSM